jgi:hypothetical protein
MALAGRLLVLLAVALLALSIAEHKVRSIPSTLIGGQPIGFLQILT